MFDFTTGATRSGAIAPTSPAAGEFAPWLSQPAYERCKRIIDVAAAGTGLLILSPLLLAIALLIRLDSPGPALFSQQRVGKMGRQFRCWKFRSMTTDAEARKASLSDQNEAAGGVLFKMKKDPRITRLGAFLRKSSLDEMPQLWNVVVGDMSLVGPRPAIPEEVALYSKREAGRLAVKPGITCFWQVSGRSDLSFDEQVNLDIHYAEVRSLLVDMKLLLLTIPAVLFARGAY